MIRITKPEKWKDAFFLKLKPIEKLVFIYLYENCDDAGFFDINLSKMTSEIGIDNQDVSVSIKSLEKTFLTSTESDKIWIKKFLLHQNRLPLDLKTPEGNFIKLQIENNMPKFSQSADFESIVKNTKKLTRTKSTSFIVPTLEEVLSNYKISDWSFISKAEIEAIYDYYESVGWKVGTKKMVDWNKSFIGCFRRNMYKNPRPNGNGNPQKSKTEQTRLDMIIESNEKIEGFDFNTLTKK